MRGRPYDIEVLSFVADLFRFVQKKMAEMTTAEIKSAEGETGGSVSR